MPARSVANVCCSSLASIAGFELRCVSFVNVESYTGVTSATVEVGQCWLSFGAEAFVFQVAIQKYKD